MTIDGTTEIPKAITPVDRQGQPIEENVWYWAAWSRSTFPPSSTRRLVGVGKFIPEPWTFFINGHAYEPHEFDYYRAQVPDIG
jgi:hypothetical protein